MKAVVWREVTRVGLTLAVTGCASTREADSGSGARAGAAPHAQPHAQDSTEDSDMQLGNFSVSLTVKDIAASRAFYETLGFRAIAGDQAQNWLILQNQIATIGLFQGMVERNTLTFNPGWDRSTNTLPGFDDVRAIQAMLRARGLTPTLPADEASTGPASLMLIDPDGNPILIDQHVPKPTN